jgi:hypothetical protein
MIVFIDQATYDCIYKKIHKYIKKDLNLVKVQCKIDNYIMREKYGASCVRFLKLGKKLCQKVHVASPKKRIMANDVN